MMSPATLPAFPDRTILQTLLEIRAPEGCKHPDLVWKEVSNPRQSPSVARRNTRFAGKPAGGRRPVQTGRRYVRVQGKDYRVLDLAWILYYGVEPKFAHRVDPLNGNDHDLTLENLVQVPLNLRDEEGPSPTRGPGERAVTKEGGWILRHHRENGKVLTFSAGSVEDLLYKAETAGAIPQGLTDLPRNRNVVKDSPALRRAVKIAIRREIKSALDQVLPALLETVIFRGIQACTNPRMPIPQPAIYPAPSSIRGTAQGAGASQPEVSPAAGSVADFDQGLSRLVAEEGARAMQALPPEDRQKFQSVEEEALDREAVFPSETRGPYKARLKLLPEFEGMDPESLIDGPTGKELLDHQGIPIQMTLAEFSALPWHDRGKKFIRFDGAGRPRCWIDRYRNVYSMPRGPVETLTGRAVTREYEDIPAIAIDRTDAEDRYLRLGYPKEYAAAAADHEFPEAKDKTPQAVKDKLGFSSHHYTDPFTVIEQGGNNSQILPLTMPQRYACSMGQDVLGNPVCRVNPMIETRSREKREEFMKRVREAEALGFGMPNIPAKWGVPDPREPEWRLMYETLDDGTKVYPSGNTVKTLVYGTAFDRYVDWQGPPEEGDTTHDEWCRERATRDIELRKRKDELVYETREDGTKSSIALLPEELEDLLSRQRVVDERVAKQKAYFQGLRRLYYDLNPAVERCHETAEPFPWWDVIIPHTWWNETCGLGTFYSLYPAHCGKDGWQRVWCFWGPRDMDEETVARTRTRKDFYHWGVIEGNSPIFKGLPEGWEPSEPCLTERVYGYNSERLENPEQMREVGWGDFTGPENPPPPGSWWLPRGVKQQIEDLLNPLGETLGDDLYKPIAFDGNLKDLEDEIRVLAAGGRSRWHRMPEVWEEEEEELDPDNWAREFDD